MYLIFDTETTGFPIKGLSAEHPKQARVLQLAAIQLNENFDEVHSLYTLIKLPVGKVIDEGAFKAHGKTWEMCNDNGRQVEHVMGEFSIMQHLSPYHIAHNIKFDKGLIKIEMDRIGSGYTETNIPKEICTMELMTPICKLPHLKRNSFGTSYKWPKLKEAYKFIFGEEPVDQHDALGDVRATAKIFRWLVDNKHIKIEGGILPALSPV